MPLFLTTYWVWIKCFCSSLGDSWMVYTQQDHLRYIPSTRKWYLEYTLLFTSNSKPTTSPRNKLEINGLLSWVLRSLLLLNKPKWWCHIHKFWLTTSIMIEVCESLWKTCKLAKSLHDFSNGHAYNLRTIKHTS
jgi:hypothetical protein